MRFPYLTVAATVVAFATLLAATIGMYSVEGQSMEPALSHGTMVLVNRFAYVLAEPAPGDLLIVRNPHSGVLTVKRMIARDDEGRIIVSGDNADASIDSRHFGPVDSHAVLGRVVFVGHGRNG